MKYLVVLLAAVGLVAVVLGVYLATGWYNVAASQPHAGVTSWALDTIADRSITSHADDVSPPKTGRPPDRGRP